MSAESIIRDQVPELPVCASEVQFIGQYMVDALSNLDDHALYSSKSINMNVGEFFTLNHTIKTVTFYQSTSKDLTSHGFKVSTLQKIAFNLSMVDGQSCADYKFVLICFVPMSGNTHGLKFIINNTTSYTLKQWQNSGDTLALRMSTYIVRMCVYPNVAKLSLLGTSTLKDVDIAKKNKAHRRQIMNAARKLKKISEG